MKLQSAYLSLVERGVVPKDEYSPQGSEATLHMRKAWAAWKYRCRFFDKPLISRNFDKIRHLSFALENGPATIASSSFFSIDFKAWGEPFAGLILNIIPTASNRTLVVFSYAADHRAKATKYFSKVAKAKGEAKEYELSCMILDRAENFFISPQAVDSWAESKRAEILTAYGQDFFGQNPLSNDPLVRTPRLNLFEVSRENENPEEVS